MNILKTIPAILLTMSMLTSCLGINNYNVEAHENADEDVTISYLGKGFGAGVAFYGDLFQIEADADFRYDVVVLTDAAYRSRYGSANALINMYTEGLVKLLEVKEMKLEDYLLKGTQTHGEQILPQGNYKVYVIGIGLDGTPTGDLYSKAFTVKTYLDCETDGRFQLQSGWKAEYLGRYTGTDGSGGSINIDRISSSGTGNAYYYHVFSAPGALKTDQELRNAFENGCGIDDLKGAITGCLQRGIKTRIPVSWTTPSPPTALTMFIPWSFCSTATSPAATARPPSTSMALRTLPA